MQGNPKHKSTVPALAGLEKFSSVSKYLAAGRREQGEGGLWTWPRVLGGQGVSHLASNDIAILQTQDPME